MNLELFFENFDHFDDAPDSVANVREWVLKLARKTARMHGTSVYVMKNGKIVAEKP